MFCCLNFRRGGKGCDSGEEEKGERERKLKEGRGRGGIGRREREKANRHFVSPACSAIKDDQEEREGGVFCSRRLPLPRPRP